jgi:hypothetical protein
MLRAPAIWCPYFNLKKEREKEKIAGEWGNGFKITTKKLSTCMSP